MLGEVSWTQFPPNAIKRHLPALGYLSRRSVGGNRGPVHTLPLRGFDRRFHSARLILSGPISTLGAICYRRCQRYRPDKKIRINNNGAHIHMMAAIRDAHRILNDWLVEVSLLTDEEKYMPCAALTSRLVPTFCHTNFDDGVLITEVFESIFIQCHHMRFEHEIDDEFKNNIRHQVKESLVQIQQDHANKKNMYDALKRARYAITQLQLSVVKFPPKIRRERRMEHRRQ